MNNRYTFTPCEELGFDAAGRLIATIAQTSEGQTRDLFYDTKGRLAAVNWFDASSQEFRTEHEYDAYNRRVRTQVTRVSDQVVVKDERYAYDGSNLFERQNLLDANDRMTYIYGPNEQLLAHQESLNGRTVYYFRNDVESTTLVISKNADGSQSQERIEYEDYGYPYFIQDDGSVTRTSSLRVEHLFQGLWWDESTGLYDVRTRYLDPVQGRFVKLDTVGIWADAVARGNGYVFAGSQPYTSGDPTGEATVKFSNKKGSYYGSYLKWAQRQTILNDIRIAGVEAKPIRNAAKWMDKRWKKKKRYKKTKTFVDYFGKMRSRTHFRGVVRRAKAFERYLRKGTIRIKYKKEKGDCKINKNGNGARAWTLWGSSTIRLCELFIRDLDNTTASVELRRQSTIYHEVTHMRGQTRDFKSIDNDTPSSARAFAKKHPWAARRSARSWEELWYDPRCRGESRCK